MGKRGLFLLVFMLVLLPTVLALDLSYGFYDLSSTYETYYQWVDFFLYLFIFGTLARLVFTPRFGHSAGALGIALGIGLSLSLVLWESYQGASLIMMGGQWTLLLGGIFGLAFLYWLFSGIFKLNKWISFVLALLIILLLIMGLSSSFGLTVSDKMKGYLVIAGIILFIIFIISLIGRAFRSGGGGGSISKVPGGGGGPKGPGFWERRRLKKQQEDVAKSEGAVTALTKKIDELNNVTIGGEKNLSEILNSQQKLARIVLANVYAGQMRASPLVRLYSDAVKTAGRSGTSDGAQKYAELVSILMTTYAKIGDLLEQEDKQLLVIDAGLRAKKVAFNKAGDRVGESRCEDAIAHIQNKYIPALRSAFLVHKRGMQVMDRMYEPHTFAINLRRGSPKTGLTDISFVAKHIYYFVKLIRERWTLNKELYDMDAEITNRAKTLVKTAVIPAKRTEADLRKNYAYYTSLMRAIFTKYGGKMPPKGTPDENRLKHYRKAVDIIRDMAKKQGIKL